MTLPRAGPRPADTVIGSCGSVESCRLAADRQWRSWLVPPGLNIWQSLGRALEVRALRQRSGRSTTRTWRSKLCEDAERKPATFEARAPGRSRSWPTRSQRAPPSRRRGAGSRTPRARRQASRRTQKGGPACDPRGTATRPARRAGGGIPRGVGPQAGGRSAGAACGGGGVPAARPPLAARAAPRSRARRRGALGGTPTPGRQYGARRRGKGRACPNRRRHDRTRLGGSVRGSGGS